MSVGSDLTISSINTRIGEVQASIATQQARGQQAASMMDIQDSITLSPAAIEVINNSQIALLTRQLALLNVIQNPNILPQERESLEAVIMDIEQRIQGLQEELDPFAQTFANAEGKGPAPAA